MRKTGKKLSEKELDILPERNEDLKKVLRHCFYLARRNKLKTADEHGFEIFREEDLQILTDDIIERRYEPGRSKAFITHNPVIREIFAAQFRDRIVHHLLFSMNGPWWDNRFIPESFSCRKGKGTDYGIRTMQKQMRRATENGMKKAYIIKMDISGYFMSLSREKLFEQILWGLDRQFSDRKQNRVSKWQYELCRYLWAEIIFDDPVDEVRMAGSKKSWSPLPKNKSLFYQLPGVGIVIGNLTSQLLSNIFLDQLDRYVKYDLGFKYYGRYVDDFYIIVPEDEFKYASFASSTLIPEFLDCIGLKMNSKKKYIQTVDKGVPFLGKFVHMHYAVFGKRIMDHFYRAVSKFSMDFTSEETIISFLGAGKHYATKKQIRKVFKSVGWDYNS